MRQEQVVPLIKEEEDRDGGEAELVLEGREATDCNKMAREGEV